MSLASSTAAFASALSSAHVQGGAVGGAAGCGGTVVFWTSTICVCFGYAHPAPKSVDDAASAPTSK